MVTVAPSHLPRAVAVTVLDLDPQDHSETAEEIRQSAEILSRELKFHGLALVDVQSAKAEIQISSAALRSGEVDVILRTSEGEKCLRAKLEDAVELVAAGLQEIK